MSSLSLELAVGDLEGATAVHHSRIPIPFVRTLDNAFCRKFILPCTDAGDGEQFIINSMPGFLFLSSFTKTLGNASAETLSSRACLSITKAI